MNKVLTNFWVLLALGMGCAQACYGEMTCNASGCTGIPYSVRADIGGAILIAPKQNGSAFTETTCTPYFNTILIDANAAGKETIYSALLTSLARGESVFIRTPDDSSTCKPLYVISYE